MYQIANITRVNGMMTQHAASIPPYNSWLEAVGAAVIAAAANDCPGDWQAEELDAENKPIRTLTVRKSITDGIVSVIDEWALATQEAAR